MKENYYYDPTSIPQAIQQKKNRMYSTEKKIITTLKCAN